MQWECIYVCTGHEKRELVPYASMENMFVFIEHQLANDVADNVDNMNVDLIWSDNISLRARLRMKSS